MNISQINAIRCNATILILHDNVITDGSINSKKNYYPDFEKNTEVRNAQNN